MANDEHLKRLEQGVDAWNAWRKGVNLRPSLNGADLRRARLSHADLSGTDLQGADLSHADLVFAVLRGANLSGANLRHAALAAADLTGANLFGANFVDALLIHTMFRGNILANCDLTGAKMAETVFANVDLSDVVGLDACEHFGPSVIDHRTLERSGHVPLAFLRGVGLPERLIDYLPPLFGQAIHYYSCFISYSARDQGFANRLHADLQNKGVRCWFAPHDMPIGAKILDEIDEAIRLRDKLVLILSEHSIKSDWVEDEVSKAFEEERRRGQTVLFPIRLDDAVMETDEAWAAKLRAQRNIGDFRRWKDYDAYKKAFERVVRDLTVTAAG